MDHKPGGGNRLQASLFPMTAVRGRHPDDLNEGIPERYDAVHPSTSKNAFEWWYFDGRFTDGHTFAGAIQAKAPQIYLHIDHAGRRAAGRPREPPARPVHRLDRALRGRVRRQHREPVASRPTTST